MRYLLIANPVSGGGRRPDRLNKALRFLRKKGDEVVVKLTSGPGDAARFAREGAQGSFDAVIGAGGDGTLHEVLAGVSGTGVPLGILPWGTGNVFARELGLPRRVKALCRVIRRGQSRAFDLGEADGRPFLLMASLGFDAYALGRMPGPAAKRLWGMGAYVLAALGSLVRYPHPPIDIRLEDGTNDRGSFVLISNTKLYGAFFVFLPQADPRDGFLDVLVFRDTSRWRFLGMVWRMVWHTFVARRPGVPPSFLRRHGFHRTRTLSVTTGGPRPAQADGEYLEAGLREVRVLPGALRVLVPRG